MLPTRSNSDKIQASWWNDIKTELEATTDTIGGNDAGDILTTDGVQTATDKTLTSPVINGANVDMGTASDTNRIVLPDNTTSNLGGLTDTAGLFAYDTDLGKPVFNDGTGWDAVGGGSGTGINHITNGDAEANTVGWTTYADAAGVAPIDGTGGSPTLTFTRNTTTPLRGNGDFLITKDAADRQGEGVSYDFTVDNTDKTRVQTISFDYSTSANYVSDDIRIYVYDVTNTNMIEVSARDLEANEAGKYIGYFQCAYDSVSYRLIIHQSSTNAAAYTVNIDDVSVGPSSVTYGVPATDEQDLNITLTNFGNAAVAESKYWRVGQHMYGRVRIVIGSTVPTGGLEVTLDDFTMVDVAANSIGVADSFSGNASLNGQVLQGSTTGLNFYGGDGNVRWDNTTPRTWAQNDVLNFSFKVPIQGWSSNVQLSSTTQNREISMAYTRNTGGSIPISSFTDIEFPNKDFENGGSNYNTATGIYTVPESGSYRVKSSVWLAGVSTGIAYMRIVAGGTTYYGPVSYVSSSSLTASIDKYLSLSKGDTIAIGLYQTAGNPATFDLADSENRLEISKLNTGSQTIAQDASVYADGAGNGGDALGGAGVPIPFTLVNDSHGAWSGTQYTIPISGRYNFSGVSYRNITAADNLWLRINGTNSRQASEVSTLNNIQFNVTANFNKGDVVDITYNLYGVTLLSTATQHYISITRMK